MSKWFESQRAAYAYVHELRSAGICSAVWFTRDEVTDRLGWLVDAGSAS